MALLFTDPSQSSLLLLLLKMTMMMMMMMMVICFVFDVLSDHLLFVCASE